MEIPQDPILGRGGVRAFARTEPHWFTRLGNRWKLQGTIAKTDRAVIVHFQWQDRDDEEFDPPHTKDVVVKIHLRQRGPGHRPNGYPEGYTGFDNEGRFLNLLSGFYAWRPYEDHKLIGDRPQNIVRHYHDQIVPPGPEFSMRQKNVVSFLEYCPGVVLGGENASRYFDLNVFSQFNKRQIDELDLWIIFKQFTRMIMMMDCGNEIPRDSNIRRSIWRSNEVEICHYDIHPGNSKFPFTIWNLAFLTFNVVLIGYKKDENSRVPMLKVCMTMFTFENKK